MKTRTAFVIGVLVLLSLNAIPAGRTATSPAFTILSATWGTTANPIEVAPGSTNVPLTVTILYTGGSTSAGEQAKTVQGVLQLAAAAVNRQVTGGFTDTFGNTTASASEVAVNPDATFVWTFSLDIVNTTKTGTYSIPLELDWTTATTGSSVSYVQSASISVNVLGIPDLTFNASPRTLSPGSVNNVSLTVSDIGSGEASQIKISISASGVSVLDSVLEVASLNAGQSKLQEVQLYVPTSSSVSSVALTVAATYQDAYGSTQSVNQMVGLYVSSLSTPSLSFQLQQDSVIPGQTNTMNVTLTNLGKGAASEIRTQIASSSQFSVLDQFPVVGSLGPNSSVTAGIRIYLASTLSGSPLTLTFTSSYTDEYGNSGTSTQTVGLYVVNTNATQTNGLVSARILENNVKVGTQSMVVFSVKNVGSYSLASPTLSLAVSSPLVVTGNSTYSLKATIRPGENVTYEATVGAGTGATPGFYTTTMTLSYVDESGVQQSQSFSFGIVLSGNIILVLQSPQVVQGTDSLVVSGSILNEGFSSAYYASVTGTLAGTKTPSSADYVGEVDPNTPVPFSVTVPYTPQNAGSLQANISIVVSYENSLGAAEQFTQGIPTTITPSGSGQITTSSGTSSGSGLAPYFVYGLIVMIVLVAVVGAVYVRRNRPRTPKSHEADESKVF